MKVLSLFSGVGGFDMGLENAGMETVFQCEWDKHANTILHKHWPDVPKWDDVSTLTGKHILANAPVVDVVAWGSPCQDLSVAGKRAGLEGGRSGLFHEGIRIIKELQEETNGQYPRISIWENVVGALNSNRGADFGIILDEMAEAGALVIEWTVLDAQYWIPQRRKRVFVIAIFDPVLAERSPSPLLPVSESLPGHLAKGKQKRESAATTLTESTGTDGRIVNAIGASIYHKQTVVNQDVNSGHLVVGALAARDYKGVGNQYVAENKCVVEPYVKSSRAQTSDDSETWIPGEVNPTLNSFDVGDTRATTAIVEPVLFENSYRDGARIANDGISQTLTSKMGTGGGNTPMIAIGIQGNVIGRQDHNGPAGKGHTEDGDPMFTLTSTDTHAVAVQYDGYNQRVNETDISLTIRIGRDSSDFIAQPTEPTVFQPGTMVRLGGGVWDGTVPTLRAEAKRGDNEPHIAIHGGEPTMAVRRLTPLECERLMGWPDDHTRYKADGTEQADTHRYKQCGNGVASPVAQWIAKHILAI
jgi:DNA (cytosine-5)-methyltransferase 1